MLRYQKSRYQNEAIIQAKLYIACKKAGLACDLHFAILKDQTEWDIPDLIVVEHDQIIAMVEVKDYSSFGNLTSISKEQVVRYESHGLPVFVLYSAYDIPYLVKRLLEIKTKFLESLDSDKAKCFEADRQNKEKWNVKIASAFQEFDETFPRYIFTNQQSLETVATGVKILGLVDVLRLMDEYAGKSVEFFSMLNAQIDYTLSGRDRFLNTRKGTVSSISGYYARQTRFDEKLS